MDSRLPPGQRWVDRPLVYDIGPVPPAKGYDYRLCIWGSVDEPRELDWEAILDLPQESVVADFHCVTRWSVADVRWEGVPARSLLELVRLLPGTLWVMAHGREGYSTDVPLAFFSRSDTLLAHSMNGKPLAQEHGAPLRLVVPSLYAWKSAKYLTGLEFLQHRRPGFWEARGYHPRGDPWREERFR